MHDELIRGESVKAIFGVLWNVDVIHGCPLDLDGLVRHPLGIFCFLRRAIGRRELRRHSLKDLPSAPVKARLAPAPNAAHFRAARAIVLGRRRQRGSWR
jgi:hypothetical protein